MFDLDADVLRTLGAMLPGLVLEGTEGHMYALGDRIGAGSLGWVFRALWNGSVEVAVKVLRPDAFTKESLARFWRDADVLRRLSQQRPPNPHVVRFYDHAQVVLDDPTTRSSWTLPFTVVELVDGVTLEQAIADSQPYGIGLSRARRILHHIVLALHDIHAQNVVHRDLTPSNVLLTAAGGREISKVTDFGMAKLLEASLHSRVGYAPPEQFEKGGLRVGRKSDVFSLAAIVYEMVSGLPAFPCHANDDPQAVVLRILEEARPSFRRVMENLPRELLARPDLIAALDAELARALSPRPEDRHDTALEFHSQIEIVLSALSMAPSVAPRPLTRSSMPPPIAEIISARVSLHPEPEVLAADAVDASPLSGASSLDRQSFPPPSASSRGRLGWRIVNPGVVADGMLAIAVAPSGAAAIGAGPYGLARWDGAGWMRLDAHASLGANIDPLSFRAAAWFEGNAVFAGASPVVVGVSADGVVDMWQFDRPGLVFHGAWADATGVLLVGECTAPQGVVGVIAKMPLRGRAGAQRVRDIPGCGPLRAVTRLGSSVLACGDGGAVVLLDAAGKPRVARICGARLSAVLALDDGTATVVGEGAFVFRVQETLEAKLEAIQTTRDLFSLAMGTDGTIWCGGDEQRVLVRKVNRWARMGSLEGIARVRAIHAGPSGVLAFCDDGAVLAGS